MFGTKDKQKKKRNVSYAGSNSFWKRPEPLQHPKIRQRDSKGRFIITEEDKTQK